MLPSAPMMILPAFARAAREQGSARAYVNRPLASFGPLGRCLTPREGDLFYRAGALAVIPVSGAVCYDPLWCWWCGGIPTSLLIAACKQAMDDDTIQRVLIDWHCPGGDVAGGSDLIAAVSRLTAAKTTVSLAHDLCTSLAYWAAVHTSAICVTPTAIVGSVGTILGLEDTSGMAEQEGIVARVVTDAPLKGRGLFGVPTPEQDLDDLRAFAVDEMAMFPESVDQRRGLAAGTARAWRGRVFGAAEAVGAGLADRVVLADDLIESMLEA